mmetsp:Transcript_7202/g.12113  ORF Transcript_7202/g.12113 Transcript_7202/m.12113 type:complete len:201 (+) Transcript_7202:425-1027(+)
MLFQLCGERFRLGFVGWDGVGGREGGRRTEGAGQRRGYSAGEGASSAGASSASSSSMRSTPSPSGSVASVLPPEDELGSARLPRNTLNVTLRCTSTPTTPDERTCIMTLYSPGVCGDSKLISPVITASVSCPVTGVRPTSALCVISDPGGILAEPLERSDSAMTHQPSPSSGASSGPSASPCRLASAAADAWKAASSEAL